MSVRKVTVGGIKYFLAKRQINGDIKQKYFKDTPAGERQALRFDAMLEKAQKQSNAENLTYIRSKYGFLRGMGITKNYYDGKLITVFTVAVRRPDGHWHLRSLDVRCGRTFKGCFDTMVEEVIVALKISKYTQATDNWKKLVKHTYTYMRAKDKYNRDISKEVRPNKTSSKLKK